MCATLRAVTADPFWVMSAFQALVIRWSPGKESRFIESLILGMPIPPVFVIELEDGKYELIDGLQRLSSYFHFRGALEIEAFDRAIDVRITRIRRKIEPDPAHPSVIRTVRGAGYLFSPDGSEAG